MPALNQRVLQPGERIRVMVVDDSVVIRRLVSQALEQDPMLEVVGTASNGAIGLKRIPQFTPDVLTLDIEMPDMNGLEMLKQIRSQYRRPRLTTGFDVDFAPAGELIHGLCKDVSEEGLRAEFTGWISLQAAGLLILRHPIGVLQLQAQVAYVKDKHVGLIFDFGTPWQRSMTKEFIATIADQTTTAIVVRIP